MQPPLVAPTVERVAAIVPHEAAAAAASASAAPAITDAVAIAHTVVVELRPHRRLRRGPSRLGGGGGAINNPVATKAVAAPRRLVNVGRRG